MTRKIKDMQPDYYANVYEFDRLAAAEELTIAERESWLLKQINNLYVSGADEDGINIFEHEYNIIPDAGDDLETRRRRIIARIMPPQPITLQFFDNLLNNLNLNVKTDVDAVKAVYTAVVDAETFTDDQIAELNRLLDDYLPIHLVKEIYKYSNVTSNLGSFIGVANTVTFYANAEYKGDEK